MSEAALAEWLRLRERIGPRATVIDLYRLVAEPRGLRPEQLPIAERTELAHAVLRVVWPGFEVTEGSSRGSEPIELVSYDPAWPDSFQAWRGRIAAALGETAVRVEHVGSTSVPGLPAKPVIDIQVSVRDIADEAAYLPALEREDLQLRTRDRLHRYLRPAPWLPRAVHVHVCDVGSSWEREHLLFRDYLRREQAACAAYAEAKRAAAAVWADDRIAYTDAKGDAILDILEAAEAWAVRSGWGVKG